MVQPETSSTGACDRARNTTMPAMSQSDGKLLRSCRACWSPEPVGWAEGLIVRVTMHRHSILGLLLPPALRVVARRQVGWIQPWATNRRNAEN